jgi:hypothetical protein
MTLGYARVSTQEQTLDLQKDALTKAGCEQIFTDTMSGAKAERPGLQEALTFMRSGDVLVVWKLDRLGRSLKDLRNCLKSIRMPSDESSIASLPGRSSLRYWLATVRSLCLTDGIGSATQTSAQPPSVA